MFKDFVAYKVYNFNHNAAWRDYVDIFFFLKWDLYPLEKIISLTKQKFGQEFNEKLFLEQLVYFKDLEIIETTFLKEAYSTKQIQSFLSKKVEEYLQKILPK
jgi:hypothetical protein